MLRFTTSDFEPNQRLAAWSAIMQRKLLQLDIEPVDGKPFAADVMLRGLHEVRIATGRIGASLSTRTPGLAAIDNDDVMLLINLEGEVIVTHESRRLPLKSGDAVIFGCVAEASFLFPAPVNAMVIRIPFATLARYGSQRDLTSLRLIPRKTGALTLLIRYGVTLFEDADIAMTPGAGRVVVDHMVDLVALAIGVPHDPGALGVPREDEGARLHVIKADILRNLAWRDRSVRWLAARHCLSTRQFYRMFEQDGMPFAEFVLEQRLMAAHGLIQNPRFADNTISEIALECGFGDISYFNRRFRTKYGKTPSAIRSR